MANAAMKNCLIGPHGPCDVTGPRHWPIADVVRESPSNVHIVSFTALVQCSGLYLLLLMVMVPSMSLFLPAHGIIFRTNVLVKTISFM